MKREHKQVNYSFEHGDESLPKLKDMVSDIEDPEKSKIIAYLKVHCIITASGIEHNEIEPGIPIGSKNIYSDGKYFWTEAFLNYVRLYNIPVPAEFRNHILKNYNSRMKRHIQLRMIDALEIINHPVEGEYFRAMIHKNGLIEYQNSFDSQIEQLSISPEDAAYIINPITSELFCYDADEHGDPSNNDYFWKLTFWKKNRIVDVIEGRPGEDIWRYRRVQWIIRHVERHAPLDLGLYYWDYYGDGRFSKLEKVSKATLQLVKRFDRVGKTDEEWLELDRDMSEYIKNECPDEEKYLFVPLGYGEMIAMICSGIRKKKNDALKQDC